MTVPLVAVGETGSSPHGGFCSGRAAAQGGETAPVACDVWKLPLMPVMSGEVRTTTQNSHLSRQ